MYPQKYKAPRPCNQDQHNTSTIPLMYYILYILCWLPPVAAGGSQHVIATTPKPRYTTMYACENTQLSIDCEAGYKINLIRANYGRFSVSQCNEQGELDLSTNCSSPKTFRIMNEKCQNKPGCKVNATSSIFGDKCVDTPKYLEVSYQCTSDQELPRVNVRDSSLSSSSSMSTQPQIYQQQPPTNSGSSPILPPNNPTIGRYYPQQPVRPKSEHMSGQRSQHPIVVNPTVDESVQPTWQTRPQSPQQQQPQQQQPQQPTPVINSEIVSYSALADQRPVSFGPNNISSEPIVVTLRHTHTENMSSPRCYSWDQAASQWTEKGGQITETNTTHTTCAFEQATSYLLVMDYSSPGPMISHLSMLTPPPTPIVTQLSVGSPISEKEILDQQPVPLDPQMTIAHKGSFQQQQQSQHQQQSSNNTSSIVKFFSLFGYLLLIVFVLVGFMTIAFIASTMRPAAEAALKSFGTFTAFSGPKYKNRRADGSLHNKDLLVINNQNGHQFLYAPANTTKINSSSSTHILSPNQGTLHQIQQQQQMYSGNGTLSNLSGTGTQSNNYYYGLMGLTHLFQQQQQQQQPQLRHHLSQHQLNQAVGQQQQALTSSSYHHQANKSSISNESANSTPSSSGVESGTTSMQQQQQQQQQNCLMMNNDYNLMGQMTNYGQHPNLIPAHQQPTLTLNTHYSSGAPLTLNHANPARINAASINGSLREHIYECVDEDKPYTARLLLQTGLEPYNSNTLGQNNLQHQMGHSARAMTISSRLMQNSVQQQQSLHSPTGNSTNKRLFSHPAIIRDNQAKTNIVCSQLVQVTPQRATEINKFQHDMMATYNGTDTTTTTATNSSSSANSASCYGTTRNESAPGTGMVSQKLSTDC